MTRKTIYRQWNEINTTYVSIKSLKLNVRAWEKCRCKVHGISEERKKTRVGSEGKMVSVKNWTWLFQGVFGLKVVEGTSLRFSFKVYTKCLFVWVKRHLMLWLGFGVECRWFARHYNDTHTLTLISSVPLFNAGKVYGIIVPELKWLYKVDGCICVRFISNHCVDSINFIRRFNFLSCWEMFATTTTKTTK